MELITVDSVRGTSLPIFMDKNKLHSVNNCFSYKLVHVEKGTGIMTINDNTIAFNAPAIFCLNNKDVIKIQNSENLETIEIYFAPTLINDALTIERLEGNEQNLSESEYRDLCLLIPFTNREEQNCCYIEIGPSTSKRLTDLNFLLRQEITALNNNFWRCRSRSFFLEILFLIQYIFTEASNINKIQLNDCPDEVKDIVLYLHTSYDKKITLENLTEKFNINRTTLTEKFNTFIGMSAMEYLIKLRINIASLMLKDTMLPISEIMYMVGFNDISHFGRMFRKHMGISPSKFRNESIRIKSF